jgi:CRAL/TRIO domain
MRFAPERCLERTYSTSGLGDGPMRFAPSPYEPSLQAHLSMLDDKDGKVFRDLKKKWERRQARVAVKEPKEAIGDFPDYWHFRFLYFTAKQSKKRRDNLFSEDRAWSAEKKLKKRYVVLNVHSLRDQLQTKTIFPVPGLRSKDNHAFFYMRPSRYVPSKTPPNAVVDNLVYVINTMTSHSLHAQREGIGIIACMDDFQMKNFEANYWYQLMTGLQGYMVPVKVQLFLIVNPPSWFGAIWQIMRPMLVPAFRRRVKIIPESKLIKYLADDYQQYLPADMKTGMAGTDTMVEDFIAYRTSVEKDFSRRSTTEDEYDDVLSLSSRRRFQNINRTEVLGDDDDDDVSIASNVSGDYDTPGRGRYASRSRDNSDDECDASIMCDIGDDLLDEDDMKPPGRRNSGASAGRRNSGASGRHSVASAHLSDMSLSG